MPTTGDETRDPDRPVDPVRRGFGPGKTGAAWARFEGQADADHESAEPCAGYSGTDPGFAAGGAGRGYFNRKAFAADRGDAELEEAEGNVGKAPFYWVNSRIPDRPDSL